MFASKPAKNVDIKITFWKKKGMQKKKNDILPKFCIFFLRSKIRYFLVYFWHRLSRFKMVLNWNYLAIWTLIFSLFAPNYTTKNWKFGLPKYIMNFIWKIRAPPPPANANLCYCLRKLTSLYTYDTGEF